MFPDSILLDREGFCIYRWEVDAASEGLDWGHTLRLEAPVFRGDYKSDRDSIQTEQVRYHAYKPTGYPHVCFAQHPEPGVHP